jgi:hypothetical protein
LFGDVGLTLALLVARLPLVDHINATAAADDFVIRAELFD